MQGKLTISTIFYILTIFSYFSIFTISFFYLSLFPMHLIPLNHSFSFFLHLSNLIIIFPLTTYHPFFSLTIPSITPIPIPLIPPTIITRLVLFHFFSPFNSYLLFFLLLFYFYYYYIVLNFFNKTS